MKGRNMKKDLPKIFRKNVESNHITNKKVYYGSERSSYDTVNNINSYDLMTVEDKIKKLFKSSRYIFNIGVIIKTDKKDYDTRIAGKVKNSLVTVNNDIIPIVEINDIIIKDRI